MSSSVAQSTQWGGTLKPICTSDLLLSDPAPHGSFAGVPYWDKNLVMFACRPSTVALRACSGVNSPLYIFWMEASKTDVWSKGAALMSCDHFPSSAQIFAIGKSLSTSASLSTDSRAGTELP